MSKIVWGYKSTGRKDGSLDPSLQWPTNYCVNVQLLHIVLYQGYSVFDFELHHRGTLCSPHSWRRKGLTYIHRERNVAWEIRHLLEQTGAIWYCLDLQCFSISQSCLCPEALIFCLISTHHIRVCKESCRVSSIKYDENHGSGYTYTFYLH